MPSSAEQRPNIGFDVLFSGHRWPDSTITYSIWNGPRHQWTDAEKRRIAEAFQEFEAIIPVRFVPVDVPGSWDANTSMISITAWNALIDSQGASLSGYAYYPDTDPATSRPGDIILNADYLSDSQSGLAPGGTMFKTLLHEIGHALGLKHPHPDDSTGAQAQGTAGSPAYDSSVWTVMSYRQDGAPAATPMAYDIMALQAVYGANTAERAGDDRWMHDPTDRLATIYDAGGIDTYDASGFSGGLALDIGPLGKIYDPAAAVTTDGRTFYHGLTVIAEGTLIENAIGGRGNDEIRGNGAANRLWGNRGDDDIQGGAGDDRLDGGWGDDTLDGGAGADLLVGGPGADVFVIRGGADGVDRILDLEAEDTLVFLSGSAALTVTAQAGATRVECGGAAVLLPGGIPADAFTAAAGSLEGQPATSVRWRGSPGEAGAFPAPFPASGGDGDDVISASAADDAIDGGSGLDRVVFSGRRSDYSVARDAGRTVVTGPDGRDTLTGVERLEFLDGCLSIDPDDSPAAISRLYLGVLERLPDARELRYWVDRADAGTGMPTIAAAFLASPEFATRVGDSADTPAFIGRFYTTLLHRQPTGNDLDYWTNRVEAGMSRGDLLWSFIDSTEHRTMAAPLVGEAVWYT